MIKLSEHGLRMRREGNPELLADGSQWCLERPDGQNMTPEQRDIMDRMLKGEDFDRNDPGFQPDLVIDSMAAGAL